jgi:peptidoglycan/xylan/chitin deacetylase (PgdA/CDA1 family)
MVNVYITVDTECSLGGAWENSHWKPVGPEEAVLGRIDSRLYGVPLIMDILEENGLRATFFTEVLVSDLLADSELAAAYSPIRDRGHDAQLHMHPVFHYYYLVTRGRLRREDLPERMDLIGSLPLDIQIELLKKGCSIFRNIFGSMPVAFRAGVYGASMATLEALKAVGILYDSSFNAAYLRDSCLMGPREPTNMPWQSHGVWEIPVTTFETGAGSMRGLKPLEVSAVSLWELQDVLDQAERLGQDTVTVMLHSFAFLKRADVQFRKMRPDHLVIRRFRKFCNFLRSNEHRFRVLTFSEIPKLSENPADVPLPRMGVLVPSLRKLVQAVNRIYWI